MPLWDNEDTLRASEEMGNALRGNAAQATSRSVGMVERFDAPVTEVH